MPLSASLKTLDLRFAEAVREGLSDRGQKRLSPEFFYDEVGSALFEAITVLPEYGLTRADRRLLTHHSGDIASLAAGCSAVIELGSGTGAKTAHILEALARSEPALEYFAIDLSRSALERCRQELSALAHVRVVEAGFLDGLRVCLSGVAPDRPALVLFLGSTIGNFDRTAAAGFLRTVRALLRPGDRLLLGADLVKPVDRLLLAYDDPAGVTAAFNLNLLARINRELGGDFDLRRFRHLVRYRADEACIEMHLKALDTQSVRIRAAGCEVVIEAGETIWTESSHKYTPEKLERMAAACGFQVLGTWIDEEWPFAETLWAV